MGRRDSELFDPALAPGNPIRERLYTLSDSGGINQAAIEEMVRAYDKDFGLDQPLVVQYGAICGTSRISISGTRWRSFRPRCCP